VVADGRLVEMHAEWAFDGLRLGAVVAAVRGLGDMALLAGGPAAIDRAPAGLAEGGRFFGEVVREAIPEAGRWKPARLRVAEGPARAAPDLSVRLGAAGERFPAGVEEAWEGGWEAAALGRLAVPGGVLRFSPTPAFLAVDVDGAVEPDDAARGLARAIRLWALGGNIVADFPTRPGRDWRLAAVAAFDAAMEGLTFERTAINGYGLLQVVRPRLRPSILERAMLMADRAEALALLDAAVREPRPGPLRIVARDAVARLLGGRPDLLAAVARHAGRPVDVVADAAAGAGHVTAG
jgi:hypothetical protein